MAYEIMRQLHNTKKELQETQVMLSHTEVKLCRSEEMSQQTKAKLNLTERQLYKTIEDFKTFALFICNHFGVEQEGLSILHNWITNQMAHNTTIQQWAAHSLDELNRQHQLPAIGTFLSQQSSGGVPFVESPDFHAASPFSSQTSAIATCPGPASDSLPVPPSIGLPALHCLRSGQSNDDTVTVGPDSPLVEGPINPAHSHRPEAGTRAERRQHRRRMTWPPRRLMTMTSMLCLVLVLLAQMHDFGTQKKEPGRIW